MIRYVYLLLILGTFSCWFEISLSISCHTCVKERCPNVTCQGTRYKDYCNCCDICSKQVDMLCGGPWSIFGKCEPGLICRRNVTLPRNVEVSPGICVNPESDNRCGTYGCAPLCSPLYCRGNDYINKICSTNGFLKDENQNTYPIAEVIRPCQGSCQKTTCGSCHLIRKPICEPCACNDEPICFQNYSKCMRAHRCRGNLGRGVNCNYNSKNNMNSDSFYIFKCMIPPCPTSN